VRKVLTASEDGDGLVLGILYIMYGWCHETGLQLLSVFLNSSFPGC
jgi:hypothetical protein